MITESQELAIDAQQDLYDADRYDAERGLPLADFECPHGHLPIDLRITCTCFPEIPAGQRLRVGL